MINFGSAACFSNSGDKSPMCKEELNRILPKIFYVVLIILLIILVVYYIVKTIKNIHLKKLVNKYLSENSNNSSENIFDGITNVFMQRYSKKQIVRTIYGIALLSIVIALFVSLAWI